MYSPFEPTQNNLLLLKVLQTWAEGGMERTPPAGKPPKPPPASAKAAIRIVRRLLLYTAEGMIGAGSRLRAACSEPEYDVNERHC